jgi:phycobilisome protein
MLMNSQFRELAQAADGRYFSGDERNLLSSIASSIPKRVGTAEAVEQKEDAVIRAVLEKMQHRYPNFAKYHDQAWARQFRDVQLVLRADAQAMVFDDVHRLDDKVLFWLRSIFAASNYTPRFVRDCFESLRDQLRSALTREDFDLLQPYLNRNVEVLSDFPEPATPAV